VQAALARPTDERAVVVDETIGAVLRERDPEPRTLDVAAG